jgi:hypothetical protein
MEPDRGVWLQGGVVQESEASVQEAVVLLLITVQDPPHVASADPGAEALLGRVRVDRLVRDATQGAAGDPHPG